MRLAMNSVTIFWLQLLSSLFVYSLVTAWYVWPYLTKLSRNSALIALLFVHVPRYVGMTLLVAGMVDPKLPSEFLSGAAYGDLLAAALALASIFALRSNWRVAVPLVWVTNTWGFVDLLNGVRGVLQLNVPSFNLSTIWYIYTFYAPLVIVSHLMIFWVLIKSKSWRSEFLGLAGDSFTGPCTPERNLASPRSLQMRSDIVPGNAFPDYQLPDHTRTLRKLSELQGDDPLILTLARGNYCPKEHHQHLELASFFPKIAVGYTQIATISTDDHHTLQEFRASVGAQWTFLSNPERTVQKDLDIQEYTDRENDPMIPHTLVLKPGLVIHRIYNGYWFWGAPQSPIWEDLRAVTSEIRPDWDLGAPGLRDAWNAGDRSRFHGWNKR